MESLLAHSPETQPTAERKRLPKATAFSKVTGLRSWDLARGITIRERLNGSGSISFRLEVPAKVAGTRRIAQFKTYDEAGRYGVYNPWSGKGMSSPSMSGNTWPLKSALQPQ